MGDFTLAHMFTVAGAAWTGVLILGLLAVRIYSGLPNLFAQWIAYKQAKAAEKAADWSRLREENKRIDERCVRLEARADHLEDAEQKCRSELSEANGRIATLEGYQMGVGQARNTVTVIESAKRIVDEKDKS